MQEKNEKKIVYNIYVLYTFTLLRINKITTASNKPKENFHDINVIRRKNPELFSGNFKVKFVSSIKEVIELVLQNIIKYYQILLSIFFLY